jgi:hypothetical protein
MALTTKGDGLGLYIADKLFELNGFGIDLRRMDQNTQPSDGIDYCGNVFVIDIPRSHVIK